MGFLFSVVGLTFIGAFVERAQGTRRFFAFFVIAGVLANVTLAGAWRLHGGGPIPYDDGPSFSLMAMFVAFGRVHGRAQAQLWPLPFAVQARYLVVILLGWFVAANLVRGNWPAIAAMAVTCVVGYLGRWAGQPGRGVEALQGAQAPVAVPACSRAAAASPKKKYLN